MKPIESPLEQPIFIRSSLRITARQTKDPNFVWRKNALTERVLAVVLIKWMARSDGHACEETERILTKDRGELLALFQNMVLVIPKDDDARFCTKRVEILVFLDSEDTHHGDDTRGPFFPESMILTQCDLLIGIKSLDAAFLFKEAIKPDLSVWMGVRQSLQKERWAVTMEVNGADEGGNRIKSGRGG